MALGKTLRESTKAKMREFADLYRGGPDEVRGDAAKCYGALHPRASKKVCEAMGCEYFNHPYTKAYLQEKTDAVASEADITQERVLKEVARIGLFDPRKLFTSSGHPVPIQDLDDDTAAAIAGIKVREIPFGEDGKLATITEYKMASKNDALEKLMKFLGAYEIDNKQKNGSLAEALMAGISRANGRDE